MEEVKEKENPRDNVTARKYRKQIEWRRIKVRQLLARGYSQSEISRELNINQPTISRDISFIYEESIMNPKIYDTKMGQENINILFGIEEGIRSIWKIIDDGRIEAKNKNEINRFTRTILSAQMCNYGCSVSICGLDEEKVKLSGK